MLIPQDGKQLMTVMRRPDFGGPLRFTTSCRAPRISCRIGSRRSLCRGRVILFFIRNKSGRSP